MNVQNHLRFAQLLSPRSQPPPSLPDGPSHKMSSNAYCLRDGRREVQPPMVIYSGAQKRIESGQESSSKSSGALPPVPGFGYNWTSGQDQYKPGSL